MYIGYVRIPTHGSSVSAINSHFWFQACRMAVELGLNRYFAKPPAHETDFQLRERRNRERTYLVLFVHDRSLSMQTGRHWMLPEVDYFFLQKFGSSQLLQDDFIRHSNTWHKPDGSPARCEDVIVSAFAQLRRIAVRLFRHLYLQDNLIVLG